MIQINDPPPSHNAALDAWLNYLTALLRPAHGVIDGLKDLTSAEIQQLEKIDSTTISAAQWGYLGAMDQGVATTDAPEFTDVVIGDAQLGTPTYDSVHDLINTTVSVGKISGDDITDNGDGTVTVPAGTGIIKTTNSEIGESVFFDWDEDTNVSLTDNSINFIQVQYNSGSPQIVSTDELPSVNFHNEFVLAAIYRSGNDVTILQVGNNLPNAIVKNFLRLVIGGPSRKGGIIIGETGTNQVTLTAGLLYIGDSLITMGSQDSSDTDFENYYYLLNGSWTTLSSTGTINNTQYNDVSTPDSESLETLTANKYGVHWVYQSFKEESNLNIVLGQGDYKLAEAILAQPPSEIPNYLNQFSHLVGKIIIQKSASSFTSIESAFVPKFIGTAVINHNDLANPDGGQADEYYHMTAAEHTEVTTFFASTDITAAEAETLTDGSDADSLHNHTQYLLTDGTREGATGQAQDFGSNGIKTDNIAESTADTGVTIDGVPVKDGVIESDYIKVETLGTPTYNSLQHYINQSGDRGGYSGLELSGNHQDGTIDVAPGTAWCKIANDRNATGVLFDFAGESDIAITEGITTYVYLDYNSGTPQIVTDTAGSYFYDHDHIILGCVFRIGTRVYCITSEDSGSESIHRIKMHFFEDNSYHRTSGLVTTETGTRNLNISAGIIWVGQTRMQTLSFDTSSIDSGTADDTEAYKLHDADGGFSVNDVGKTVKNTTDNTYTYVTEYIDSGELVLDEDIFVSGENYEIYDSICYWYNTDGGSTWTCTKHSTQIDNAQYNKQTSPYGLQSLTSNRFGVHWVYCSANGENIHIVYGQGNYTASGAEEASIPSTLPPIASGFGILIAKIICQEGTDTLIISYPWSTPFTTSLATDHGSLAGLGDDDHPQYLLTDGTREGATGHDSFSDFVANEHIDHTGVTLTAGTGLTGGGDISANRTFNVDVGIADDKIVQIDDADAADDDYAKFTANGLEGRSYAEVLADLSGQAGSDFSMNTNKITDLTDPAANQDAATKKYVDDNVGGVAFAIAAALGTL